MSDWESDFAANAPLVIVTGQLIGEHRLPVTFAVRREPNNQYDSGWNFLSGYELATYLDDPNYLHICPLQVFLDEDPSLQQIIDAPIGTSWERVSNPVVVSGDEGVTQVSVWRKVEKEG